MNPEVFNLSMEQQFTLAKYTPTLKQMGRDDLENVVADLMQQLMVKDNVIKSMVKDGIL